MPKSLKSVKKNKPRVIKRHKKKRFVRSEVPQELVANAQEIRDKLGVEPSWDERDHVEGNYERSGLVADVNAAFGRNRRRDVLQEKVERQPELLEQEPDDEFKAACAQMRSTGKAAPKRLTAHQKQIVRRLIAAHGEDVEAMQRDRKLNSMQHSVGALNELLSSYRHWGEGQGVDFRVPHKRLW